MTEVSDGRSARRERNRDAVLDALLELTSESGGEPSIDEIADRAGVSYRSVYRYFTDRTEMKDAATERAMAWVKPLLMKPPTTQPDDPLDHRIDEIVDARVELYFQLADILRASLIQSLSDRKINEFFQEARLAKREQLREQFRSELNEFSPRECELRLSAMDIVFTMRSIDYFLFERDHSREELERFMRGALRAALTTPEVGT